MTKSATALAPIPKEILDESRCYLLHEMIGIFYNGEIITICKECNKEFLKRLKNEKKLQKQS